MEKSQSVKFSSKAAKKLMETNPKVNVIKSYTVVAMARAISTTV